VRALGLDLGSKRIGVAISDSGGLLATPYEVLARSGDRARDHRRILELADEAEVEAIVVGLPLSLDGSVGPAAKRALAEVAELGATTDLPVETYDERLSTVTADRYLMEMDLNAVARRKVVDKVAAAVILQSWLDSRAAAAPHSIEPDVALPADQAPDPAPPSPHEPETRP
jgi:putative Holliday junction resolvase